MINIAVVGVDETGDGSYDDLIGAGTATAQDGANMYWTYTIIDDDDPPTVYFTNSDEVSGTENGSVDEGSPSTLGISLSAASEITVTIY